MAIHMIRNARVSFPHLFQPSQMGAYGAQIMLDPEEHADILAAIKQDIKELMAEKLKGHKLPPEKVCLREGGNNRPEYEGYWVLSANQKPLVVDNSGRGHITDEADCAIYAGCRVNAKVDVWAQNNQHGKRINAKLLAIQFSADDTALDGTYVPPSVAMEGFGGVTASDSFLD